MGLPSVEPSHRPGTAPELEPIDQLIAQAQGHAESLTFQLNPPVLHEEGIVAAARWLADDLGKRYDLRVDVQDDGEPKSLDEASRVVLFRALRELLINVARHAGTREAHARLERHANRVTLDVWDHGRAFDADEASWGFGLASVRERLRSLGGGFEIESSGKGTWVRAHLWIGTEALDPDTAAPR